MHPYRAHGGVALAGSRLGWALVLCSAPARPSRGGAGLGSWLLRRAWGKGLWRVRAAVSALWPPPIDLPLACCPSLEGRA